MWVVCDTELIIRPLSRSLASLALYFVVNAAMGISSERLPGNCMHVTSCGWRNSRAEEARGVSFEISTHFWSGYLVPDLTRFYVNKLQQQLRQRVTARWVQAESIRWRVPVWWRLVTTKKQLNDLNMWKFARRRISWRESGGVKKGTVLLHNVLGPS